MSEQPTILIVEDERESADLLAGFLKLKKFNVVVAYDGKEALEKIESFKKQLNFAVLDVMIPYRNGYELCTYLRNDPITQHIPVLFLTAKEEERDQIAGLNSGGDIYLTKPASLNLIFAHIQRWMDKKKEEKGTAIHIGKVTFSPDENEVRLDGALLELTTTEYQILSMLFQQPKRVFSRAEILENITDEERLVFDRTVDVHIKNLRIKLKSEAHIIKTYRGLGYGINKELV